MGIWIRTQNKNNLVEVTGIGIVESYQNTEIEGLNQALRKEHLRIL